MMSFTTKYTKNTKALEQLMRCSAKRSDSTEHFRVFRG